MPDFIKAIGAARFGVMAGVAAALTAFFLYTAGVLSTPPKSILFSGLEQREASAVAAKLDAMNVPYELKGDGGTIMVPGDQVTKLRMELAQENLPSAGVGYEIFDKSDAFGTTAFVQNINRLRAIEGELARSIATIEGVESTRVHLVVPERQIFQRDQQNPSGSVVLKTKGTLGKGQVQAIQHLVAAAVAGLTPDHVAIVDDKGNLLAGGTDNGDNATALGQEQHTTDFEERIRQRVESMVASVVGHGHVRAQVTANLDYNRVNETSETFDPDSKVVRSTNTIEHNATDTNGAAPVSVANSLPGQQQAGADSTKSSSGSTEEITNYEISKTVKTSVVDQGVVKKLSVAVVVDGEDKAGKYTPRTAEEMKQIEALVKSAIGFDQARGDAVQVVNMPFARVDTTLGTPATQPMLGLDSSAWFKIIEAGIFSITALLIGLFVLRPLTKRMFAPLSSTTITTTTTALPAQAAAAGELPAPSGETPALTPNKVENMIDIQRIEGQVRESSVKKVGEVVSSHPEEALAILRSWLHQPV
ncbi:flagellar M-ring protein FliF [Rhizomicrobium palustre]|uniref:Flagellar M-ring protein n=1 Tax=Rhizomicrobium palustre TaxID=189966 RepID=A0A846MXD3_9PROT|nr:flagellar basal-body MS-ring/collar protein FliF [Rhizomicrobium palustre]NIK87801.1 flagellar M-ring protein FliF [Rhizomicrobium palustre]